MRTEDEIKKHILYLENSTDKADTKQMRELNIRISELMWVLV